jgi:general secretion pathway protein G
MIMKIPQLKTNRLRTARRRAFTLVEMLLVVTIIGILAALVIPKIMGRSEQARNTAANADINGGIKSALDAYEVDNGFYPKGKNGLGDLVQQPRDSKNWRGPYLDKLPTDPWGNAYIYEYPGKHNASSYDLYSMGPDGKGGTEDDIGNWAKK